MNLTVKISTGLGSLMGLLFLLVACGPLPQIPTGSESVSTIQATATALPTATLRPTATFPSLDPTYEAQLAELRDPSVPALPFADNPDPALCGIPVIWGLDEPAWLNGFYEGKLWQADLMLYDSHLRLNILATAPHGAEVSILLFQENPTLDYYLVKVGATGEEGWIPEPFLSFDPVAPLSADN